MGGAGRSQGDCSACTCGLLGGQRKAQHFASLFAEAEFRTVIVNTIYFATMMTLVAQSIGIGCAILIGRTDLPGRRVFGEILLWPLFISHLVLAFGWFLMFGPAGYITLAVQGVIGTQPWNLYSLTGMAVVAGLALVDIDRRAVEAARRNVLDPRATFHWEDARRAPPLEGLDFVVMNPPFHDSGHESKALGQAFIRRAHDVWNRRVATGELNRWFEAALERHQPPLVDGRRLKMRYITQAKARPPTFIVFGTRAEQTPDDYQRYLVNSLRDTFELPGTPVRLLFRGSKNPYAEGSER